MALRVLCATLARRASSAAQQQQLLAPALLAAVQGGLNTSGAAALSTATAALPLARVAAAHQQLPPSFAATGSSAAFASRADGSDDDDENEPLESVLRRELKHEQATYEQPEAVAQGPPAPFTLTSAPGDGTLTLTRDFNGEKVTVEASLNMQEGGAEFMDDDEDEGGEGDEDEDDEPAFSSSVSFVVTVERNGEALVFDCASDGAYLEIEHVALEPAGGAASETAYSGARAGAVWVF